MYSYRPNPHSRSLASLLTHSWRKTFQLILFLTSCYFPSDTPYKNALLFTVIKFLIVPEMFPYNITASVFYNLQSLLVINPLFCVQYYNFSKPILVNIHRDQLLYGCVQDLNRSVFSSMVLHQPPGVSKNNFSLTPCHRVSSGQRIPRDHWKEMQ